jgi:hypothetical protein
VAWSQEREKKIMKKAVAITVAAMLTLLAGCSYGARASGDAERSSAGSYGAPKEETAEKSSVKETGSKEPKNYQPTSSGGAYPISYEISQVRTNYSPATSKSLVWLDSVIEVKNTGSLPFALWDAKMIIRDAEMNALFSKELGEGYPEILAPGEKGYYFASFQVKSEVYEKGVFGTPKLDIRCYDQGSFQQHYLPVIDDFMEKGSSIYNLQVKGTVLNDTDEEKVNITAFAVFYDVVGNPVELAASDFLLVGEDGDISINNAFQQHDVDPELVDSYKVFVYLNQLDSKESKKVFQPPSEDVTITEPYDGTIGDLVKKAK